MRSSGAQQDKLIKLDLYNQIAFKPSTSSRSLRVVVITNNAKKFEEFRAQLGDGYGMEVEQYKVSSDIDLTNESALPNICAEIMANQETSPHFILREDTTLTRAKDGLDWTNLPLLELAKHELESVQHSSALTVYKPQWVEDAKTKQKSLTGFTVRKYEKRSYGYIKPGATTIESKQGFGWDSLFVNAAVNLTNEEFYEKYGKKSARQHTISDFIETYLRYKALKSLEHHSLKLTRPIDFGENYISLREFASNEKHMSNPFISDWGIDKLRNSMINEGLFFKAAWSRPVKNYFSPPFSGLPLTEKKDEAEETIFMTHDSLHHLICDLICNMSATKESFHVYSAWRMMSEACTLVLADMFYANGLMKMGIDRSCVDKRIYPLFEAILLVQNISDPAAMSKEDKASFIKKLLYANVRYALLGDDSEWQKLLVKDGTIDADHLKRLEAYKAHFGKFFIGDNAWTRANFDNMQKNKSSLNEWVDSVGADTFRQSHVPLLSDVCAALKERGVDLSHYDKIIEPLFNYMFETKIQPVLMKESVAFESDDDLRSHAFRRFLIGQSSLFSRYPIPLNLGHIKDEILLRLKNPAPFSSQEQNHLRKKLEQCILGLEGLRLMSREEALNAIDCTPVFPPVYISYVQMQKRYHSIESCVEQCIASYQAPVNAVSSTLFNSRNLDKATQCDDNVDSPSPSLNQ